MGNAHLFYINVTDAYWGTGEPRVSVSYAVAFPCDIDPAKLLSEIREGEYDALFDTKKTLPDFSKIVHRDDMEDLGTGGGADSNVWEFCNTEGQEFKRHFYFQFPSFEDSPEPELVVRRIIEMFSLCSEEKPLLSEKIKGYNDYDKFRSKTESLLLLSKKRGADNRTDQRNSTSI